jgi:hypothetical protein
MALRATPRFVWQSRRSFTNQFGHPLGLAAISEQQVQVFPTSPPGRFTRFHGEAPHLAQRCQ